ncbi:MAG TPA: LPS export ABC transporter permease LptG [Acidiferrobacter sp.]|nr:LPS export ABC transporter permease LptG [Acidiferrobacter sp.]
MRLIDRYIARRLILSTILVLTIFVGLFLLFDLVTTLGQTRHESLYQVFLALVLGLPAKISTLFPMSALVGSTLGLSSLAIDGELTALRAAGVSIGRIAYAALRAALVLALLAAFLGDLIGPMAASVARAHQTREMSLGVTENAQGLWFKEGRSFVNIGEVLPDLTALRITIYQFGHGRLERELYAVSGHYRQGTWQLSGVSETLFQRHRLTVRTSRTSYWKGITPRLLSVFAVNPHALSPVDLFRYIRHLHRNHQATAHYALVFWYKVLAPFTTAAMVLLAVPFVFRHSRHGGLGFRLFLAVVLGLFFFVFNRGFGDLSLLYHWPPVLGASLPTLSLVGLSAWLLTRVG